jgi:NAD(P)-dependent dehydrogenase (short-subunit alcohol dehydrogenase family)
VGEKYGQIDVMVVGGEDMPGAETWKPLEEKTDAEFKEAMDRDIWGSLWILRAALPYMREKGASIIFVFSSFGQYASRHIGDQMAGRWGALGLSRTIANEWGRFGIRANSLVPLADTPGFRAYRVRGPETVDSRVSAIPMKRVGDPVKDIGGAALFLASDDTRYVNAQVVYADGGSFLSTPVVEAVWDL